MTHAKKHRTTSHFEGRPDETHNSRNATKTRLEKTEVNQRRAAEYRAKFAPKED